MAETSHLIKAIINRDSRAIARAISLVEDGDRRADLILTGLDPVLLEKATVIGITGPPGAGKSTLTDKLIGQYREQDARIGVIAIDPSSPISGGAILGDRVRMMEHALDHEVVMRSMASRGRLGGLCGAAGAATRIMAGSGCSIIIIETVGVGQSEMDIIRLADITALVVAPGLGDDIQAMKAGLLEVADLLVVNKADCPGAEALAMDMEAVAREKPPLAENLSRVCLTTAIEGRGVQKLAATLQRIDRLHRHSDEHTKRRQQARAMEVLDWSLEMLRPRLQDLINRYDVLKTGDPRLLATRIIKELMDNRQES
ncbi:MAG: methylmalonyl Co-A mutase-associated GTPase MeaB [Thermodesulfobacteriota bacterium]